jgi:glucose-1-phosphate adenylyltransferase
MDLLGDKPAFDVSDSNWKIHSRNPIAPPHYIGENAVVTNSMIALGAEIDGVIENSIISSNVIVENGAIIKDSVIMSGAVIKKGAIINYSVIDEKVIVGENVIIGEEKKYGKGIAVLGRDVKIADGCIIGGGAMIDSDISKEGN